MKGITPKIYRLCFVLINSVLLNPICAWIVSRTGLSVPVCVCLPECLFKFIHLSVFLGLYMFSEYAHMPAFLFA